MIPTTKEYPASVWGIDLLKEVSTSGATYTLSKVRNSLLTLPEIEGDTLAISIENLSALVATFRGQSATEQIQFQTQLGANELKIIYLPFAEDYLLSTDQSLKISSVSVLKIPYPATATFDEVEAPSPLIQVTSANPPIFDRGIGYKASGLINVLLKQKLGKQDFVRIGASGAGIVWRIGDMRFRSSLDFRYVVPATHIPVIFSCSSEKTYWLSVATQQRKYENPAYVAPEAQLWSFENSAA